MRPNDQLRIDLVPATDSNLSFEFAFEAEKAKDKVPSWSYRWWAFRKSAGKVVRHTGRVLLLLLCLCSFGWLDSMSGIASSRNDLAAISTMPDFWSDTKAAMMLAADEPNKEEDVPTTSTVPFSTTIEGTVAVEEAVASVLTVAPVIKNTPEPAPATAVVPKPAVKKPAPKVQPKKLPKIKPALNIHKGITSAEFQEAAKLAHRSGKKVFIKFGASWCLPCKMMEETVFNQPDIQAKLQKDYIVFNVDIASIDGMNLKHVYKIQALPSFVILNQNAELVARYSKAKSPDEMRKIL